MKAWFAQHVRALSASLAKLGRAPLATALNVLVFGVALSLPAGLYAGLDNLQRFAGNLERKPQISLFLTLDASAADTAAIESRLRQNAGIASFAFVPRENALEEFRQQAGLGDVIAQLSHRQQGEPARNARNVDEQANNPLPDAFVINANSDEPRTLDKMRAEFAQWPAVEHATLDSAWAEKLAAAVAFGRLATLFLATLLSVALIAVVFNTIRLQILTLRDEIEVARLIGATDPFIRRPFLYYGAAQGFIGGLLACLIIAAAFALLDENMRAFAELYAADFRLRGLAYGDSMAVLAFSAVLGWLGARLSVGRHLKQSI
ncbi:MAG: permease-like cell division protein FtsX [Pseudomonadota bacterium]|nr:permease-like cell division protein FtsX [Pseudomonadota bacterium]